MHKPAKLYGLMLFSHGWARILTVMSPQGIGAVIDSMETGDGARLEFRDGGLPQFHEIRAGSLERLIETHGVTVLNRQEWEALKKKLGAAIYG